MILPKSHIFMQNNRERIGIGISLQKSTLDRIDADRGDVPRSRIIERALEEKYALKPAVQRGGS